MSDHYILEGHKAIPCDLMTWAQWFEKAWENLIVARTGVGEGAAVSTVFLGLDHSFSDGVPLIFETLVFGGPLDGEMERYSTWDQAEAGHAAMVHRVEDALAAGLGASK